MTIIARHPMRQAELERALQEWGKAEIDQALKKLRNSGQVQVVERYGVQFWSAIGSYYPSNLAIG